jgi:hypothetical protein
MGPGVEGRLKENLQGPKVPAGSLPASSKEALGQTQPPPPPPESRAPVLRPGVAQQELHYLALRLSADPDRGLVLVLKA